MTAFYPKALIFDFEGTLVDFQWRLAEAEGAAALANLGMIPEGQGGSYADLMNNPGSQTGLDHCPITGPFDLAGARSGTLTFGWEISILKN
jgi:phosphoglycolate phosphatase-like HAD superfamily hydrolase